MTATTGRQAAQPACVRSFLPDLAGVAAALSMIVVVALWAHNGNVQALGGGIANALISLGRLTGLISADLLLIQVLLMARLPWVERAFGQDKLARWHRLVGFTSIDLMLAHILLITVGYAGTARAGLLHEGWNLVTTYPGMLLAAAATVALLLVAVTSVRMARARLRYESWHLLHLYAYLGVGLSIPHELWTGADFTAPAARAYWWTLYGVAAGCIVVFRLALPLWRSLRHGIRVEAVVPEAPGVTSVWLRGRELDRLPVRAGQFFSWRFLDRPGWTRAQPYSLSAAPRPDMLRITVKELGDGSSSVRRLRPGSRVLFEGPYGRLTGDRRQSRYLTMIASGIGITPIRALLESENYRPGEATLIYRARTPADFAFRTELDSLAKTRGVRVFYVAGRRGSGWAARGSSENVRSYAPYVAASDVFVCGPPEWMASVVRALHRVKVPDDHIHLEEFAW